MKIQLLLIALLTLVECAWVSAVHIVYDSSSMWAQSQSVAADSQSANDSEIQVDWMAGSNDSDVFISTSADVSNGMEDTAYCEAFSEMFFDESGEEPGSLSVSVYGYAYAETGAGDASTMTNAGAAGVSPGESTGLFFKIVPDSGEQMGDRVNIQLSWQGYASVIGNAVTARSDGGFLAYDDPGSGIVVALNPADKIVPPQISRVWEHVPLNQFIPGTQEGAADIQFQARIGDVIGIFVGVHTEVNISGENGMGQAEAWHEFSLVPTYRGPTTYSAADADINGDGWVNLEDFAIMLSFWLEPALPADGSTCQNAISVSNFGTVAGDNDNAGTSPISSCAVTMEFDDSNAVWYKFTSPVSANINFTVTPSEENGLDASLALYDACNGNELACDEQWVENITWYMNAGQTIYIRIGGYELDQGSFELTILEVNL